MRYTHRITSDSWELWFHRSLKPYPACTAGNPVVGVVGVLTAAFGLGGYNVFTGRQGKVASQPKQAAQAIASRIPQRPQIYMA